MRFSLSFVVAMAASVLAADPFEIDTPASSVQCGTTVVTWTGGVPPFNLAIVHDRTAEHATNLTERTFTWSPTDVPASTIVFFQLIDATSHTAQSSLFAVQPSTDFSCLSN